MFIKENIPKTLQTIPSWAIYKMEPRLKNGEQIGFSKAPRNPKTGVLTDKTNPDNVSDFETACNAITKYNCDGIGFILREEFNIIGCDIDHCYDPEKNALQIPKFKKFWLYNPHILNLVHPILVFVSSF